MTAKFFMGNYELVGLAVTRLSLAATSRGTSFRHLNGHSKRLSGHTVRVSGHMQEVSGHTWELSGHRHEFSGHTSGNLAVTLLGI